MNLNEIRNSIIRRGGSIVNNIIGEFDVCPLTLLSLNTFDMNQLSLFRVRGIEKSEEDKEWNDISKVKTFSYPEKSVYSKEGRANVEERPVFYCSDEPLCSIYESKVELNKMRVFFGVWKFNLSSNMRICPLLHSSNFCKEYLLSKFGLESFEAIEKGNIENSIAAYNFLLQEFINTNNVENQYSITSKLSDELIYKNNFCDGIWYPSNETNFKKINWAINTNFVDNNLLKLVKVYEIGNLGIFKEKITTSEISLRVGEVLNDTIKWRAFDEQDRNEYPLIQGKFTKKIP